MDIATSRLDHKPKVSIGMPVYNGENFIRDALNSLLAQTFMDFELIVSDNASTDGTEVICREYAARDSRIRYVRQNENYGVANFQFVLDEANGEYFMWAAADDEWLPNFISECLCLAETDKNIGFVVTDAKVVSRFSPLLNRRNVPPLDLVAENDPQFRVTRYLEMPDHTHKDNLVYAFWRTKNIRLIIAQMREMLGRLVIGNEMNVYALGLYKGGHVKSPLFRKRYRYAPPGHCLGSLFRLLANIRRKILGENLLAPLVRLKRERFIKDLEIVLHRLRFDETYVKKMLEINYR